MVSQKVKGRITIEPSSSTPRYKPKRTEEMYSHRCIYTLVHGSTTHKSQKVETVQVSVSRWMDKQNVTCAHNGIVLLLLLSLQVLSDSWLSCGLQQARLPCPPLSPGVCSDSCPLSPWCYLTISPCASLIPFCLQPFLHQDLFQWIGFLHQMAKVLELQHQSFQWIFRVNFL